MAVAVVWSYPTCTGTVLVQYKYCVVPYRINLTVLVYTGYSKPYSSTCRVPVLVPVQYLYTCTVRRFTEKDAGLKNA